MDKKKNMDKIYGDDLTLQIEEKDGRPVAAAFGLKEKPYFGTPDFWIAQVHVAGQNRYFSRGGKNFGASESINGRLSEVVRKRFSGGEELLVTTESELAKVYTHFRFFDGIKAVQIYNEVENVGKEEICLEEVNCFLIYPLAEGEGGDYKNMYFLLPRNSWHVEAQWERKTFAEWGLYNGNGRESMKKINVFNTGSWSTKEYLPMGGIEDEKNGRAVLWQIENNGSWQYELGEAENRIYLNVSGPDYTYNGWSKILKPGERFEGVKAAVVFDEDMEAAFGEMTKYRRKIRRENRDNTELPVIYNSYMHCLWDYPTPEALSPLIDEAAKLGADYFCIDAGWHDEKYWWDKIGRWETSKTRFPGGLEETVAKIKSRGMTAGIWIEPECVGVNCPPIEEFDEDCYFSRNGKRVIVQGRYLLDFSAQKVRDRMDRIIDRLVETGFGYIKTDHNIDGGIGTETGGKSAGDGLLRHNRAYLDWLRGIYARHPSVVIESCASGGCCMDYALLSLNSVQSTSDQTNYLKYPYIAANASTAVTPEQAAVWSYPIRGELSPEEYAEYAEAGKSVPVPDPEKADRNDIIINMVNCMLGRMHLASHIELLSERQKELVKEGIAYYRSIREDKIRAVPYFPNGLAEWGSDFVASGLKTDKKAYLAVWNLGGERERSLDLRLSAGNAKIGYPSGSGIRIEQNENDLKIIFSADKEACIIEFEVSGGKR